MKKCSKIMIAIVCLLIGTISIKAETINYTLKQYRVQYYSLANNTTAWNSWTTFGTSTSLSEGYGVRTVATRFGYSSKFSAGVTYRVVIENGYSPASTIPISFLSLDSYTCNGSNSMSSWSNDASLIAECNFIGAVRVTNSNHVKYVFDITPTSAIQGIQFNLNFGGTSEVRAVNTYTTSSINAGENVTGAIEEQTIILEETIKDIEVNITNTIENSIGELLDQEHTYDIENPIEDLQEENEEKEQAILEQLEDLMPETGFEYHIWMPTRAIQYIWSIFNRLFTLASLSNFVITIMCLGLVKMVLNR